MYALVLMTATIGADPQAGPVTPSPAPAPTAVPAAPVGGGCIGDVGGCSGATFSGGHSRAGLLDRIKARHGSKGCHGSVPATDCCAPAPAPVAAPAPCCDAAPSCCGSGHAGLLTKIKARGHSGKAPSCCSTASGCCDGCAAPAAPASGVPGTVVPGTVVPGTTVPPGTTTQPAPPKEMPKPKEKEPVKIDESASNPPLPTVPAAPARLATAPGTPY